MSSEKPQREMVNKAVFPGDCSLKCFEALATLAMQAFQICTTFLQIPWYSGSYKIVPGSNAWRVAKKMYLIKPNRAWNTGLE